MKLPTDSVALALLKKYNNNEHVESLVAHSRAVSQFAYDAAKKLSAKKIKVNVELVRIAGLLHDIGKEMMPGPCHSIASGIILRKEGYEALASVVEKHGLSKECMEEQGKDGSGFVPQTIEERVLCFADAHFEYDKKIHWSERIPLLEKRWKPEHMKMAYKARERFEKNNKEIEKLLQD